ncbi:DNA primase large subunit [Candidatus Caldarchaeum subterraneum]|uniref:DNA primase large subunit PriL n=1 Tax=Caldiarchaeum subterraneum TaxID=311458 RepID=E6N6S3_CALS0|nr:DNA primase large subunit [Candidatus Caldarchaeum subterraneum]BAJ50792.1 DNA primase large subunit [Candidatus Caldarchaeum subterraneum]
MTPKINLRLLATYPFLQEAKQFAKALDITEVEEEVLSRAGERVIEAIERYEVTAKLEKPFIEFASYPVAKMIVHHLSNDWLRKRWALAEAVRVEKQLNIEILQVFEHVLKSLNITVKNVGDHYMIHFTDYLRLAERLTSNTRWKLVNRTLSRGYVHLTRSEVCRLAREAAYNIFSDFSALPKNLKPPEKILNQLNEINQILAAKAKTITTPSNKNEWPPCIHAIANRISDASHFECFTLAAFLTNKGYTVEQVVDIFRARADFDEKIARYQVEHIAGKRGSGTIYRPPSCPTMQAHNLCIEKGKLCPKNIKNPLQYGMMDRDASSAAVCF